MVYHIAQYRRAYLFFGLLFTALIVYAATDRPELNNPALKALMLFTPIPEVREDALQWMRKRNKTDVVPALIYALRYLPNTNGQITSVLEHLTGSKNGHEWSDWMLWQQAHPEIKPFDDFAFFQSGLFSNIDPNFEVFLYPDVKHEIRLEEIAWGGVHKDGIPALTNPELIHGKDADYLSDGEAVFGIEINGDARAYPYRIMDWHEMFNDVIGSVPVSLAYCTLCGSAILYDTRVKNRKEPFVFGSSGFLYRSNKLMYDQQTHSLWNQFTGRPVVGKLTGSDIELKVLPVVTTTWKKWRTQHPDTKVLSINTGHQRDYRPGAPYGDYFASQELMFPALLKDNRLKQKERVFGLRITGAEKAWPLSAFDGGKVINDRVGAVSLVLIGDTESRTVRAYRSGARQFKKGTSDLSTIIHDGQEWKVSEAAILGPEGGSLSRLPGHLAYWFAWSNYLGQADFFEPK